MNHQSNVIESIDGGIVHFDAAEETEADACNADTFGDDALEDFTPSVGFFDVPSAIPSAPAPAVPKEERLTNPVERLFQMARSLPVGENLLPPPPGLEPLRMPVPPKAPTPPPVVESRGVPFRTFAPPPPPPPAPPAPPAAAAPQMLSPTPPEILHISTRFGSSSSSPAPPPPPPPPPPPAEVVDDNFPRMSIHVYPVRVFPTPFTALQRSQAVLGHLDANKWGPQAPLPCPDLMTKRDKEFVMKIQLNQMAAVSSNSTQNFRGQFTFGRSKPVTSAGAAVGNVEGSSFGKQLYSNVFHPRKLVQMSEGTSGTQDEQRPSSRAAAELAETCFDALLHLSDVDEYIATLHPLAEDKIRDAIVERTQLLEEIVGLIVSAPDSNGKKFARVKKRTIDSIVALLQPQSSNDEADARRSLIFRRVPEAVQGFYIDLLEKLVGGQEDE